MEFIRKPNDLVKKINESKTVSNLKVNEIPNEDSKRDFGRNQSTSWSTRIK
jgi:hypothetical protein